MKIQVWYVTVKGSHYLWPYYLCCQCLTSVKYSSLSQSLTVSQSCLLLWSNVTQLLYQFFAPFLNESMLCSPGPAWRPSSEIVWFALCLQSTRATIARVLFVVVGFLSNCFYSLWFAPFEGCSGSSQSVTVNHWKGSFLYISFSQVLYCTSLLSVTVSLWSQSAWWEVKCSSCAAVVLFHHRASAKKAKHEHQKPTNTHTHIHTLKEKTRLEADMIDRIKTISESSETFTAL